MKRWFSRLSIEQRRTLAIAIAACAFGLGAIGSNLAPAPMARSLASLGAALATPAILYFLYLQFRYPVRSAIQDATTIWGRAGLEQAARELGLDTTALPYQGNVRGIPVALGTSPFLPQVWVDVSNHRTREPLREWTPDSPSREESSAAIVAFVERLVAAIEADIETTCITARASATVFDRRDAVRKLGAFPPIPAARAQLEVSLQDPDVRVRLPAAIALDRLDAIRATDERDLLLAATGVDAAGRGEACLALGRIGTASTLTALVELKQRGEGDPAALSRAIGEIAARLHIVHGELSVAAPPPALGGAVSTAETPGTVSLASRAKTDPTKR